MLSYRCVNICAMHLSHIHLRYLYFAHSIGGTYTKGTEFNESNSFEELELTFTISEPVISILG